MVGLEFKKESLLNLDSSFVVVVIGRVPDKYTHTQIRRPLYFIRILYYSLQPIQLNSIQCVYYAIEMYKVLFLWMSVFTTKNYDTLL